MSIESSATHLEKKVIASLSSGIAKLTALIGKKVGPLDVLCRENLRTFVVKRRQRKGKQQTVIEDHLKKKDKQWIDEFFADALYECGLPFNTVNKLAVEVLCEAIGCYGRGYRSPSVHQVRKLRLEKKFNNVVEIRREFEVYWKKYGVTLMYNGWTDRQ